MATTGKIPSLGFRATAIKFAVLFGFSPEGVAGNETPRAVAMTGSYAPAPAMAGSYVPAPPMAGSYVPSPAMTGSVSE